MTITFSEEVSGFTLGDITVTGPGAPTAGNLNTSNDIIYTATITPTADGTVNIDVLAAVADDLAGTANTKAGASLDMVYSTVPISGPGVVITSAEPNPTLNSSFSVTITFDETVQDFVVGDITVVNGTAGNFVSHG